MRPGFVQATGGFVSTSGTSFAQAYGGAVTAGNLLLCVADSSTPGGVQSVSDSINGAWAAVPNSLGSDGARDSQVWFMFPKVAGTPTVTLNVVSSANYRALMVAEYSRVHGIDAGAKGSGSSTTPAVVVPVSMTDSAAVGGTFVINTGTPAAGFNDRVSNNGDHLIDTLVPGVGLTTLSWTQTTGGWATTGVSLMPLPGFQPPRMPIGV